MNARFPSAPLRWSGEGTPGATGWLEARPARERAGSSADAPLLPAQVSVAGQLVHSKKNGDGYIDSPAKEAKMCVRVATAKTRGGKSFAHHIHFSLSSLARSLAASRPLSRRWPL